MTSRSGILWTKTASGWKESRAWRTEDAGLEGEMGKRWGKMERHASSFLPVPGPWRMATERPRLASSEATMETLASAPARAPKRSWT